MDWRRSTYCSNGGCVEVAAKPDVVLVRDAKTQQSPELSFPPEVWQRFIDGLKER